MRLFLTAWSGLLSYQACGAAASSFSPQVKLQKKGWQIETLNQSQGASSKLMVYDLVSKMDWMQAWLDSIARKPADVFISPDGFVYFYSRSEKTYPNEGAPENNPILEPGVDVYRILPGWDHPELFVEGLHDPLPIVFDDLGHPFTLDVEWNDESKCRWIHLIQGAHYGTLSLSGSRGDGHFNLNREAEQLYAYQLKFSRSVMPSLVTFSFQPIDMIAAPSSAKVDMGSQQFFLMGLVKGRYQLELFSCIPTGTSFDVALKDTVGTFSIPMSLQLVRQPGLMLTSKASDEHNDSSHFSYRLFDPKLEHSPESFQTQTMLETDPNTQDVATLIRWLDHSDRRVRVMAQVTLADRRAKALESLVQRSRNPSSTLGRLHALWTIRMILSQDSALWKESVHGAWRETLLEDPSPLARAATLDLIQTIKQSSQEQDILRALNDDDARVRFRAVMMIGKRQIEGSEGLVMDWMIRPGNQDGILQHAAVLAISDLMSNDELSQLATHSSSNVRMAAVLALQQKQHSGVQAFLGDEDPEIMLEAGSAILSESIRSALPALAQLHDTRSQWVPRFQSLDLRFSEIGISEPMLECVYAANAILGQPIHLQAMSEAIETNGFEKSIRSKISKWLMDWLNLKAKEKGTKRSGDGYPSWKDLDAIWRPRVENWIRADVAQQRRFMLDYIRFRDWEQQAHLVERIFRGFDEKHKSRVIALKTLADWQVPNLSGIIGDALISNSALLRKEAVLVQAKLNPSDQVAGWVTQLESGNMEERKDALNQIGVSRDRRVDSVLLFWLEEALVGRVPSELHEALKHACQQRTPPAIQRKLVEWQGKESDQNDSLKK